MLNIYNELIELDFFKNPARKTSTESFFEKEFMMHLMFEDEYSDDSVNSILVVKDLSEGNLSHINVSTNRCILQYSNDTGMIAIVRANVSEDLFVPIACDEGQFFQLMVLEDLGKITHEYVKLVQDVYAILSK